MAEVRPIPDVSLTLDEAGQRECPLIRVFPRGTPGTRRGAHCPGWRWARGEMRRFFVSYAGKPEEEWIWNPTGSKGYEGAAVRVVGEAPRGFCGYAGKPQ